MDTKIIDMYKNGDINKYVESLSVKSRLDISISKVFLNTEMEIRSIVTRSLSLTNIIDAIISKDIIVSSYIMNVISRKVIDLRRDKMKNYNEIMNTNNKIQYSTINIEIKVALLRLLV